MQGRCAGLLENNPLILALSEVATLALGNQNRKPIYASQTKGYL